MARLTNQACWQEGQMIRARKAASLIGSNILLIFLGGWGFAMPTIAYTSTNETIPARALAQSQQGLPPQPTPPPSALHSPVPPEGSLKKIQLENDKLTQEVEKLKREGNWFWNNSATVGTILVATAAGLIGVFRWLADWREERRRRAEDRFQSVVGGLGNADLAAKIGAAVTLRTFLRKGYEGFYVQVFNLAVAYLQLQTIPSGAGSESDTPSPLTRAFAIVFREAFPLARDQVLDKPDLLDATGVWLKDTNLSHANLDGVWMPQAHLASAKLNASQINRANLIGANLTGATLDQVSGEGVDFTNAILVGASLKSAVLPKASFEGAELAGAVFENADLKGADLSQADLTNAILLGADLSGANPQAAKSVAGAKMYGAQGLTNSQIQACQQKGADFTEGSARTPPQV
jgi:uncharacterized protein YjbI with pentapeptide repeats